MHILGNCLPDTRHERPWHQRGESSRCIRISPSQRVARVRALQRRHLRFGLP